MTSEVLLLYQSKVCGPFQWLLSAYTCNICYWGDKSIASSRPTGQLSKTFSQNKKKGWQVARRVKVPAMKHEDQV